MLERSIFLSTWSSTRESGGGVVANRVSRHARHQSFQIALITAAQLQRGLHQSAGATVRVEDALRVARLHWSGRARHRKRINSWNGS